MKRFILLSTILLLSNVHGQTVMDSIVETSTSSLPTVETSLNLDKDSETVVASENLSNVTAPESQPTTNPVATASPYVPAVVPVVASVPLNGATASTKSASVSNAPTAVQPQVWRMFQPGQTPRLGIRIPLSQYHSHNHHHSNPQTRHYYYGYTQKPAQVTSTVNCPVQTNKRDTYLKNFDTWYLNILNHDVMFSVCGTLMPAHRILLESDSETFSAWLRNHLTQVKEESGPIVIKNLDELIINGAENGHTYEDKCPDEILQSAFKVFLHYFYVGSLAFDSIDNIDVALTLWRLGQRFLPREMNEHFIEPKIIQLMNMDNLNKIYRFASENKVDTLKEKWSKYIAENSASIGPSQPLPFSCEEVGADIQLLDIFLQSLNSTQETVIKFIHHYLENCPDDVKTLIKDANSFPNSLAFFRCTVNDLKQLVEMGLINYEIFAEELVNRLAAKERVCDEYRKISNYNPSAGYAHLQQMEPYITAIQRRRA